MAKHHDGKHIKAPSRGHMHLKSRKGKDEMAHESHHKKNAEHDMHHGFCPPEHYEDGGCDHHLGDNVAHED